MVTIIKRNGTKEGYDFNKIVEAIKKSAARIGVDLSDADIDSVKEDVEEKLADGMTIGVDYIHSQVESSLSRNNMDVANSYITYRNYKSYLANSMDQINTKLKKSFEERDRSNGNMNDKLFSAKRVNASSILLKEFYLNEFMTAIERQAYYDSILYPHDMTNRPIGTHNCCVIRMENIMDGGFNINGYFCKEPKSITKAVSVMGDILVSAASAQYGGFTLDNIDTTLAKYCEKSYDTWLEHYVNIGLSEAKADKFAEEMTIKLLEDAIQGFEFEMNTRESSRGDYPFMTIAFGADTSFWGREVSKAILNVRMKGHGDKVKQKMIFPKLVFRLRYDDLNDDLFDLAVRCNGVALYPDYIDKNTAAPMGEI